MQRQMTVWLAAVAIGILLASGVARAESAQQAFESGESLLAKADFEGALKSFADAARADRSNQDYLAHYTMVRRVVQLQKLLGAERDAARWDNIARGLRAFYISEGLYGEALSLDEKRYSRQKTAAAAIALAETQLALDKNAEAAAVLAALEPARQTTITRALHGLALARQGEVAEARQIAGDIRLPKDAGPGVLYRVAWLDAAVGNEQAALGLLTRCFESVAPSRLASFKSVAKQAPEFAALATTAAFEKVLKTESKVPESKCSGGKSCAGCPMRGQCSKGQGQ